MAEAREMRAGELRVGVIGAGFWARYQVAGWREMEGVRLAGVFNRTVEKAKRLGEEFGIERVYADVERMLDEGKLDVVDVITDVDTHSRYVKLAAERGIAVICQKPMGASLEDARGMLEFCRERGVELLVHENWRWQTPLRELKKGSGFGGCGAGVSGADQHGQRV